jgi:hypothetical protein
MLIRCSILLFAFEMLQMRLKIKYDEPATYLRKAKIWRVVRNLTILASMGECIGMFFINLHLDYLRNSMVDEIKNFKIPRYLQIPIWVIISLEILILLTTFVLIITNIEFFFNKYQVNTLAQENLSTN